VNELVITALIADALRKIEKTRLKKRARKPRKDHPKQFFVPSLFDFYLLNFSSGSGSKSIQEV
jgi:hypothetical protein